MNIQPQPVPSSVTVSQAQGPNGNMVVLTVSDPTGLHVWFFPPENAKKIGADLQKAGEAGGIILAPAGSVPNDSVPPSQAMPAAERPMASGPTLNREERRRLERELRRQAS